ncbi:LysR family transcriptional regulator [Salmonella enterica subsp. enterica serovar Telelkebir]|uniref:LysR family transcriptional regulator n=1 Tax=Salmonella enterica TaxID=28901 RepID=A0A745IG86_SALER|nr:LysR family transcriptional regulator [Salmonella enterica]EBS2173592.1 LysR family transcriptional regulator [Salmonella enterica subsp. enterica serovar Telelkebir]EBW8587200.1 LysR family transcriptional regulator [Salmonella enterica subsp. enterica serovar Senftenberg]AXD75030.1 LysR family transcriptional regulator [Salmonella enterica]EAO3259842.1 LysR family transcriptional regulator [Salmonella enterica]EAQ4956762.1 LysR family transcriptional regulator [Salmonella enterica]
MFELSQLRFFLAVATELNFSRAAKRLNMTQPPLSRQIQLLEHQLGVELFDRTTRSVVLTAAGRRFFIEAQDLLQRAHVAMLNAQKMSQGNIGSVNISFVASAVYAFLPMVVARGKERYPHIDISLKEMTTGEQFEALRLRQSDIGLVRAPSALTGVSSEILVSEPFVLAVPRQHELATLSDITIAHLDKQSFIMYALSAWQPFYELLTGMFRSNNIQPDYVQYIGSTLTILSLVNAGMGMAFVPESAARILFDNIVYRHITLPAGIESLLYLAWRDDNDNPAFKVMLELIKFSMVLKKK